MLKKKKKEEKVEKVHFGITVTPEVRRDLKILCVQNQVSIVDFLTEVYEQLISGDIKLCRK